MKKIITIVIAGLLVLATGSTAFAAGQSSGQTSGQVSGQISSKVSIQSSGLTVVGTSGQGTNLGGFTQQGNGNTEAYQTGKLQFEQNRQQVRLNNTQTTGLKTQINDCSEQLKDQIQNMLQNRANISNEEMVRITEAIQTLQKERERITLEHQGKIQEQVALLDQANLEGDIEAANAAMNRIQTEQQARITELNKVLQDLQELLDGVS